MASLGFKGFAVKFGFIIFIFLFFLFFGDRSVFFPEIEVLCFFSLAHVVREQRNPVNCDAIDPIAE